MTSSASSLVWGGVGAVVELACIHGSPVRSRRFHATADPWPGTSMCYVGQYPGMRQTRSEPGSVRQVNCYISFLRIKPQNIGPVDKRIHPTTRVRRDTCLSPKGALHGFG